MHADRFSTFSGGGDKCFLDHACGRPWQEPHVLFDVATAVGCNAPIQFAISDVNKAVKYKAKAKTKAAGCKAKAKDLGFKAKAKMFTLKQGQDRSLT